MTPERWQQIEQLYHAALEQAKEKRAAFLDAACAGDETLRREVESLLASYEQASSFIESSPVDVAAGLIAEKQFGLMLGRTLGHYQIRSLLGAGGMGEVYRAHDTRLDRDVAIKILPAHLAAHPEALRRFEREAKAVAKLSHPNILAIHDFGTEDGVTYAVMELLEGETLRDRVQREAMKWREAVQIGSAIADGLAAAHAKGIIHRDLKPGNIFLTAHGQVKILDFGIARVKPMVSPEDSTLTSKTATTKPGTVLGTVAYMSPEQIRGQQMDERSDIFSLGLVLFEMVAGRKPFAGDTLFEVAAAVLNEEAPSLGRYARGAPDELERIVSKALAKERTERYQTARDLLLDLQNLKLELEVENRNKLTASPAQLPPLSSRKFGRLVFVVGLLALVLIGVFVYRFYVQPPGHFQPPGTSEKDKQQVVAPHQVELMRYSLGLELADGNVTRATNQTLLTAGQKFRFHFSPRARGHLYIVGPGEGNIPRTFLTALPLRSTGVTTNHLEAGVEYSFPLGASNAIRLGAAGTTNNFTVIFSPTPLSQPAFLAAIANRQLTGPEQRELAAFWERHGKRAPELKPDESLKQVMVFAPANRDSNEPLIFEISVQRQ